MCIEEVWEGGVFEQTVGLSVESFDAGVDAIQEGYITVWWWDYLEVSGVSCCEFLTELVKVKIWESGWLGLIFCIVTIKLLTIIIKQEKKISNIMN